MDRHSTWTLFFFISVRQVFDINSFIPIFKYILKLNFVCLNLLKRKVKPVLPFYWFSKGLEVQVRDVNRIMGIRK